MIESAVNFSRYIKGQNKGHYESFFQRANHPSLPQAFWIRYTIFSPDNNPGKAIGELWAVYFDGNTGNHISVKKEVALGQCVFENNKFFVRISDSIMENEKLLGSAETGNNKISWDLKYSGNSKPFATI